jgi:hypothetical protein
MQGNGQLVELPERLVDIVAVMVVDMLQVVAVP